MNPDIWNNTMLEELFNRAGEGDDVEASVNWYRGLTEATPHARGRVFATTDNGGKHLTGDLLHGTWPDTMPAGHVEKGKIPMNIDIVKPSTEAKATVAVQVIGHPDIAVTLDDPVIGIGSEWRSCVISQAEYEGTALVRFVQIDLKDKSPIVLSPVIIDWLIHHLPLRPIYIPWPKGIKLATVCPQQGKIALGVIPDPDPDPDPEAPEI
jgi:hypothetical protein